MKRAAGEAEGKQLMGHPSKYLVFLFAPRREEQGSNATAPGAQRYTVLRGLLPGSEHTSRIVNTSKGPVSTPRQGVSSNGQPCEGQAKQMLQRRGSKQLRFPVNPHSSICDFNSSQDLKEEAFLVQEPLSSCPLALLQPMELWSD